MRPFSSLSSRSILVLATLFLACSDDGPTSAPIEGVVGDAVLGVGGRPFAVRVSAGGHVFVTQQDLNEVARFRVGDATADAGRNIQVGADPGDVLFTKNGRQAVVSTFFGGAIHLIDVASGEEQGRVQIGNNAYRLALSSNDARIFVTTVNGTVHVIDRLAEAEVDDVVLGGSLQAIARRPNSDVIAVASTAGNLWLLDGNSLDIVEDGSISGAIQDLAFSPDGTKLFVASEAPGWIAVLDGHTLAQVDSIGFIAPFGAFGLAVSPDGSRLVATASSNGVVAVIDAQSHEVMTVLPVGGSPRRVAFDARGRHAFVANEANRVDVIR
jgi:YVTN family beta-propeller protein